MPATVEKDFVRKSFDQAYENFRKATESTLKMQQDLFRQWSTFWPDFPKGAPAWKDQIQKFHKEWIKSATEWTQKYQETWDRQYKAGLESLEEAFRLGEYKDPTEFREKVVELWQKSFDALKELAQSQAETFQSGIEKWMEVAKKTTP